MTIANIERRKIPPTHPGEMLREDFMPDYGLTASSLAQALGISSEIINDLLQESLSITPIMALRLSRLFDNSPEFWLNAQLARDLWATEAKHNVELGQIKSLTA